MIIWCIIRVGSISGSQSGDEILLAIIHPTRFVSFHISYSSTARETAFTWDGH